MEQLKHECGVAMIRLLKPLDYYEKKYGTRGYAWEKLYLLMEKQHNRGQEGAGVACVNMEAPVGTEYMFRERAEGKDAITKVFERMSPSNSAKGGSTPSPWVSVPRQRGSLEGVQRPLRGAGERSQLLMGHLRYSTTGKSGLQYVHPFLRRNNWRAKNLCLCGNFNMTNIDEIFNRLTAQGQSPRIKGDAYIMLELMGHRLDREVERLFAEAKEQGLEGTAITEYIEDHVEMANVLKTSMRDFDGGYVMCGMTGSGEMFAVRDPWGIRPAFYYKDDEIIVVASERPVIQTTFNLDVDEVKELKAGEALIVHRDGSVRLDNILNPQSSKVQSSKAQSSKVQSSKVQSSKVQSSKVQTSSPCSFERIYFSRGSDRDIYQERKKLGEQLIEPIMKAIGGDIENTVFSYIPNTAEVAYYGLTDGFRRLHKEVRTEKVVWKDIKLRTFITEGAQRNDLAAHVYDISYGSLRPYEDNLVIIDDSIVRGTTLRESIFKILHRLHPKKIVMVSSSPQIRYPDYYGIDMSHLEELCAFRAAIALLKERGMQHVIDEVYEKIENGKLKMENHVRAIYEPFTAEEINRKIVEMLRPEGMDTPIELVFQSIEGLHKALSYSSQCTVHSAQLKPPFQLVGLPEQETSQLSTLNSQLHYGDWYFTGHYPTPGGTRLVNQAFVEFYEKKLKIED